MFSKKTKVYLKHASSLSQKKHFIWSILVSASFHWIQGRVSREFSSDQPWGRKAETLEAPESCKTENSSISLLQKCPFNWAASDQGGFQFTEVQGWKGPHEVIGSSPPSEKLWVWSNRTKNANKLETLVFSHPCEISNCIENFCLVLTGWDIKASSTGKENNLLKLFFYVVNTVLCLTIIETGFIRLFQNGTWN